MAWVMGWLTTILLPIAAQGSGQVPATVPAIYREWCAGCHGVGGDGRGPNRPATVEPFDFTDCRAASAESDADWHRVITHGGASVGLSPTMPPFGVLTGERTAQLIRYLRGFCQETGWPSGNLNFPRAVFTAKAFPEDEVTVRPLVSHSSTAFTQVRLATSYERRVGRRGEIEVTLPVATTRGAGGRVIGIGDASLQGKYVLAARPGRGILSGGAELSIQTGSARWASAKA